MRQRSFFRRFFETAPLALWVFLMSPCVSWAQSSGFRIGVLTPGLSRKLVFVGLKEGLNRFGYREAENASFVVEDTEGQVSGLMTRAEKLLDARPDALFAVTTAHALAAKEMTATLPIVFAWVGDPIGSGLAARSIQLRRADLRQAAGSAQGDCAENETDFNTCRSERCRFPDCG